MSETTDPAAVARGKARWAGVPKAERSEQMRALAKRRAKRLSQRRRSEIARMGAIATNEKLWPTRLKQRLARLQSDEKRMLPSRSKKQQRQMKRAGQVVRRAVRLGILARKPCEICGNSKSHAHHDNYWEPLAVRWLCPKHHRLQHNTDGRNVIRV